MAPDTVLALAGFAFVSSVTPGPNNLMVLSSGANFGFRRTVPHVLGISLGHGFLILCVGLGLAALLQALPVLGTALRIGALVYMTWLAWKIATAAPIQRGKASGAPLTFFQAAAFQWINPKGWSMAITAIAAYANTGLNGVLVVVVAFVAVNLPSVSLWAALGTQVARLLETPRHLRMFNWTMAALLMASLAVVL